MIPYFRNRSGLTFFDTEGNPFEVSNNHPKASTIRDLLASSDEDALQKVLDIYTETATIANWSKGELIRDKDGNFTYQGYPIHGSLVKRITGMIEREEDFEILVKFLERLYKNPSKNSVDQLYGFLEANNLPFTDDGCFLAYKKVAHNYLDLKSGTFDNSIGSKPVMPRHQVNDDKNVTCSTGLHVASYDYMAHYGTTGTTDVDDRIVICKVDPEHVVSVPIDYENAKMRVSTYEVVGELPRGSHDDLVSIFGTADVSRAESAIGLVREFFPASKMNDDIYEGFGTDYDVEQATLNLFKFANVTELNKTVEETTSEFLDDILYSCSGITLVKFILNKSSFGR